MPPNLSENQPAHAVDVSPGSIPPVGGVSPAPAVPNPQSMTHTNNAPGMIPGTPQKVEDQVKHLVQQYGRDPFKLSGAFAQLKERHLAEQYQVAPSPAEK